MCVCVYITGVRVCGIFGVCVCGSVVYVTVGIFLCELCA